MLMHCRPHTRYGITMTTSRPLRLGSCSWSRVRCVDAASSAYRPLGRRKLATTTNAATSLFPFHTVNVPASLVVVVDTRLASTQIKKKTSIQLNSIKMPIRYIKTSNSRLIWVNLIETPWRRQTKP